jgi:hypothetical protein
MISAFIILLTTLAFVGTHCTTAAFASSTHHHTSAYWIGFGQGKIDRENNTPETPIDMCNSSDLAGIDALHCVVGYLDGLNGRSP